MRSTSDGVLLTVKVHPGSRRNRIVCILGDVLKVEITAPPELGKANRELINFLAEQLKIERSLITILRGERSRTKILHFSNFTSEALEKKIFQIIKEQKR
ncbi:MAG: DUF167 domain-containing protein [Candidatus Sumerlaeia bacterium]|nr:DUF167 domain-containing protein [Candidatus Sumerlaeia bacterium]